MLYSRELCASVRQAHVVLGLGDLSVFRGDPQCRCCLVRESCRKSDLSRCIDRAFGPLLPRSSCSRQCHYFKGGTPMGSKIYVGGLPYSATEQQLSDLFAAHGAVASARIITDKFTGQSRGFGFVEMSSDSEAQAAITALNGSDMGG